MMALAIVSAAPAAPVSGEATSGAGSVELDPRACSDEARELTGSAQPEQAKTYEMVPFEVPEGTARIEIGYEWSPTAAGVVDLGVWDASGTSGPDAFRAWAGSRQGRIDEETAPLVIAPDRNERTVVAAPIEPGTWHLEMGYAAVDEPLTWRVELRCVAGEQPEPLPADPVDPTLVARDEPGWYAGDFHLHGYHSNPQGPDADEMIEAAVAAGLDIVPVTEYVTPAHWDRLGQAQRDHPDVLLWPGREVITYFGHLVVLSETRNTIEHRVGHEGITVADIQRSSTRDGGLVSLAHPTLFPPDTFGSACRGCFAEFLEDLDLEHVQLVEVVTESVVAEVGGQEVPNPFVRTAVDLWEQLLRDGHRLTAVSGSDSKLGDRYGATSTMVWAEELSRPAVDEALRRGHAYVRGLGEDSPEMELSAVAADGSRAGFGDTLVTESAELSITVRGGAGQVLSVRRNGTEVERFPISDDDVTHAISVSRTDDEGPLGTFWGAELIDVSRFEGSELLTVIANPVFLADELPPAPSLPDFEVSAAPSSVSAEPEREAPTGRPGATPWLLGGAAAVVIGGAVLALRRSRAGTADAGPVGR
jgi:hypothetical protein